MMDFSTPSEAPPSASAGTSARVMRVLEAYLASLERGVPTRPEELLAQHPDLAEPLREYLASLEFLHRAAVNLNSNEPVSKASPEREGPELGQLGDFRLLREIGRGGMGVVYEAEQISLSRRVALKVLPFAAALHSKQLQRFKNEAQAAAHLHHSNIVPVYGVGCERGVHYYVMQYIEGLTLAAVIQTLRRNAQVPMPNDQRMTKDQCPGPQARAQTDIGHSTLDILWSLGIGHSSFFRTVANLGLQTAEALEHAHELGVVHRDIKPANLLVDECGNLWITDFGLAHCQSQAGLTLSGDLVGTLCYMSPEQALGKRGLVDHRADIYSLGVTLYEMLTLEAAFSGNDREEVLQQIAFEEPLPPRQRNKSIPRDLETIVLKAVDKSPDGRYASAQELADDLRRFLERKPILAKRPTVFQRTFKWCRRNPLLAGALSMVAATLVLGTVVAWLMAAWALAERDRANEQAQEADTQRKAAKAEAERANREAYSLGIRLMQQAWDSHNITELRRLLDETEKFAEHGFEWYYWQRLSHAEHLTLVGHTGAVTAVTFAPDGRRLATGGRDGTARIWDARSGQELLFLRSHRSEVTSVAFAPNGQWLVTGSTDGTAKLWNSANRQVLHTLGGQGTGSVWALAVTPDGQRVVTGCEDGTARIWDADSGQELVTLDGHAALPEMAASTFCLLNSPQAAGPFLAASALYPGRSRHAGPIGAVAVTPDGKRLVTAGQDGLILLWDATKARLIRSLRGEHVWVEEEINGVAVTPDGKRLITASNDNTARVWEMDTGRELLRTMVSTGWILSVATTPDGKGFITGHSTGAAKVWNTTDLPDIPASTVVLLSSSQSRGALLAASALYPGRADTVGARVSSTLMGHTNFVTCVAVSPDGKRLATASLDGTARVWDRESEGATRILRGHSDAVGSIAITPDGQRFITGSDDGTAEVWETTSGRPLLHLDGPKKQGDGAPSLAVTPDGQRFITGSCDGVVRAWDLASGLRKLELPRLEGPVEGVRYMALTPDGQRLLMGTFEVAQLWNLASGRKIRDFKGPPSLIFGLHVTPDGQRIIISCLDGNSTIWDINTGHQLLKIPECTAGAITSTALTPHGERLITGHMRGTATVWDAADLSANSATSRKLLSLEGHTDQVTSVAVTPDEQRIITGSVDGTVRIWDAQTGRELLTLTSGAGPVWSVAVTPDGQTLLAGCKDGTVRIWEAASAKQTALWARQDQEVKRRAVAWQGPMPGARGFIQDWLILGPLAQDETGAKVLERTQLVDDISLRPRAGEHARVGDQDFAWQARHEEEPTLDLNRLSGKLKTNRLAYALCYVISAEERQDLFLQVGSNAPIKVFLNRQEIHKYTRLRALVDLDPVGPCTLRKGKNVLLLKTVNRDGGWFACARFVDAEGNPVAGLEVRLTPE